MTSEIPYRKLKLSIFAAKRRLYKLLMRDSVSHYRLFFGLYCLLDGFILTILAIFFLLHYYLIKLFGYIVVYSIIFTGFLDIVSIHIYIYTYTHIRTYIFFFWGQLLNENEGISCWHPIVFILSSSGCIQFKFLSINKVNRIMGLHDS